MRYVWIIQISGGALGWIFTQLLHVWHVMIQGHVALVDSSCQFRIPPVCEVFLRWAAVFYVILPLLSKCPLFESKQAVGTLGLWRGTHVALRFMMGPGFAWGGVPLMKNSLDGDVTRQAWLKIYSYCAASGRRHESTHLYVPLLSAYFVFFVIYWRLHLFLFIGSS